MRKVLGLLALVLMSACSGDGEPTPSPTSTATSSGSSELSCPLDDPEVCSVVLAAADALLAGDAAGLVDLSRPDLLDCDETTDTSLFPQCADADSLRGFFISGSIPRIEVIPRDSYAAYLSGVLEGIDPGFSDDVGSGEPEVIGVGTCGTADPESRSYHLVFTAAISDDGGSAERVLGSFEVVNREGAWAIGFFIFDRLAEWETVYTDPLAEHGCPPLQPLSA